MAIALHLPKIIKRVTVIEPQNGGSALTVYSVKEKRKKKQSRGLGGFEKMTRRQAEAIAAYASTYLARHTSSNRKRRDGWLRDMGMNVFRAGRKSMKKLKLGKLW
jgi:Family of unknown function (DUF6312)